MAEGMNATIMLHSNLFPLISARLSRNHKKRRTRENTTGLSSFLVKTFLNLYLNNFLIHDLLLEHR